MHILFRDGTSVPVTIKSTPLASTLLQMFKHLQHVEIPFREQDSPFYLKNNTTDQLIDRLISFGKVLGIDVDRQRCIENDQSYFNHLHQIYENQYNGDTRWLDYHEHIHILEDSKIGNQAVLEIDYREKAGPLEKKFDPNWLEDSSTFVNAGSVYIKWAELGKSPYVYWKNEEPNDISRICQLAKPWLKLRPKLLVAFNDIDFLENKRQDEFNCWWSQYHDEWCRHWNIESWSLENMFAAGVIGTCEDVNKVKQLLEEKIYPVRVMLS